MNDRLISRLCTQAQFDTAVYADWCGQMGTAPVVHRKQWEFVYIAQALHAAGMLKPGSMGVGFGVGREPLPALFAAYGAAVLASDAPQDVGGAWTGSGQYAADLAALPWQGICDRADFERLVSFMRVDMNAIPQGLRRGDFDFAWSACSLDHLGSLAAGLAFIRASLECVRPGGMVVHTTEFNLSSDVDTVERGPVVLYRERDLRAFAAELCAQGHAVELDLTRGDGPLDGVPDVPPYTPPHIALKVGGYVTTSVGLAITKGKTA